MNKRKIAGTVVGLVFLAGVLIWIFTAPYLSNQGLGRMPGVVIGGTPTPAPADFTQLNEFRGPLMMKHSGFPPVVVYLLWAGTPDGVITATRPDGSYWAKRIRSRGGEGYLRIDEATYAMEATEIVGENRLPMMTQWAARTGRMLDETLYPGSEPLREWEVFFWTPRSE